MLIIVLALYFLPQLERFSTTSVFQRFAICAPRRRPLCLRKNRQDQHACDGNFGGSSPSMELEAAKRFGEEVKITSDVISS